jgi:hypothetical protein
MADGNDEKESCYLLNDRARLSVGLTRMIEAQINRSQPDGISQLTPGTIRPGDFIS